MEKRKRFEDELLDLENPGTDDSFLNEYLQDEESKKKLKKASPVKTIKISFKLPVDKKVVQEKQIKVVNDKRLSYEPKETKFLGYLLYTGAQLLPGLESVEDLELFLLPTFSVLEHYSILDIRIPAEYLSFNGNIAVKAHAVWGTEVYTDDSDIVGALIHSGKYKPLDDPNHEKSVKIPEYDLNVTIKILPRLVQYQGSIRNGISSRSWGSFHDGESYKIEKVETIPLGSAKKYRRKVGSKDWVDQSLNMKHDSFRLLITPDQGWVKYTLEQALISPLWKDKLKQNDLIFSSKDNQRLMLSWSVHDEKYKLSDQVESWLHSTVEFTENGVSLDGKDFAVLKYVWRLQK